MGGKGKVTGRNMVHIKAKQESLQVLETKGQSTVDWRQKRKGQEYKWWDEKHH